MSRSETDGAEAMDGAAQTAVQAQTSEKAQAAELASPTRRTNGAEAIARAFDGRKAFIPFVTCGDPDMGTTLQLVRALSDAGASIIELGIPFSDPTAEGPVIQEANVRSLANGTTTDDVLELVRKLRQGDDFHEPVTCPLVIMTYANVVFHYGTDRFCERAAEAGIDGLILPDVPFEEKAEFANVCEDHGLVLVSMIAPTSDERIAMIASEAKGFVYLVSSLGVTGVRSSITTDLGSIVERIRETTDVPIAIGFGISNPEQAKRMADLADGAIVGSAIVRIVAEHGRESVEPVREFAEGMVEALTRS